MRKILLMLICAVGVVACQTKNEYRIYGEVQGVPDSTVIYLGIMSGNSGRCIASDPIIDGKFFFSDTIGDKVQEMFFMFIEDEGLWGYLSFWIGKGDTKVSGKTKFLAGWIVENNTAEQIENQKLLAKTSATEVLHDSLSVLMYQNYMKENVDEDEQSKLDDEIESLYKVIDDIKYEHLKDNYNSIIAVKNLFFLVESGDSLRKEEIKELYYKIDTIYMNTLEGEGLKNLFNRPEAPKIGEKYVDFQAFDIDDKAHRISDFNDKLILLNFTTRFCAGCVFAKPYLKEMQEKYKDNLHIIDIHLGTNKKDWINDTKQDSLNWLSLSDGKGVFGGASHLYGIDGYPTFILIDKHGIIVERWLGYDDEIEEKIKEVLAK